MIKIRNYLVRQVDISFSGMKSFCNLGLLDLVQVLFEQFVGSMSIRKAVKLVATYGECKEKVL